MLLGLGIGMAVWAKYFIVVQAAPLALFALFDREARKTLATPGPWIAVAVALVVMSPHLVWLVQNDFLPFAYAEARAVHFKGALDYLIKPSQIPAVATGLFSLPSLLIAAPYLRRDVRAPDPAAQSGRESRPTRSTAASSRCWRSGRRVMIVLLSIGDRTRCRAHVGLSAVAVPGSLDRLERTAARPRDAWAHRLCVGRRFSSAPPRPIPSPTT